MNLMRPTPPASPTADRLFGRFFTNHERVLWKLGDVAWDAIDDRLLDERSIAGVRAAMLVESHNPVYAFTLLTRFRHDFPMTSFLAIWTYEEFKHFAGLKAYLEAANAVPAAELAAELQATRAGDWVIPDHYTDLMMATYAMVQECVTGMFYKYAAQQVHEPVLRDLLTRIGKDEYRHCQFYFDYAKEKLDADRARMGEVDETLMDFVMPGPTFVPDYPRHSQAMLDLANPGMGAFKEAFTKVSNLVGKVHLLRLAGDATMRRRIQENWGFDARQVLAFS